MSRESEIRAGPDGSQIHHIGVMVEDLASAVAYFRLAFGIEPFADIQDESTQLNGRMFQWGPVQLELFERGSLEERREALAGFKAKLDHIAVLVPSLSDALVRLGELGGVPETEAREVPGWRMVFVSAEPPQGMRYQLLQALT